MAYEAHENLSSRSILGQVLVLDLKTNHNNIEVLSRYSPIILN